MKCSIEQSYAQANIGYTREGERKTEREGEGEAKTKQKIKWK